MPGNVSPSPLANIVAARDRMSKVRQRIGLETTARGGPNSAMRSIMPLSPRSPKQDVMSAQEAAVLNVAQLPSDRESAMLSRVGQFISEHGAQQQALLDQERAAPAARTASPTSPPSPPQGAAPAPATQRLQGIAMRPIAAFFRRMGRLPTPEELQQESVRSRLAETLGREPTPTETQLYLSKPEV